jgi:hypothetical protein
MPLSCLAVIGMVLRRRDSQLGSRLYNLLNYRQIAMGTFGYEHLSHGRIAFHFSDT